MARYTGTVASRHSPEDVWRYLADLRSVAEWDPSVEAARLVSGEPGSRGARFEIEVGFLGRRISLPYEAIEVEPPMRVRFTAQTPVMTVSDEARISPRPDGGSSVNWDAELRPRGIWRVADPLLQLAFGRIGSRAERGLEARLAGRSLFAPAEKVAA